MLAVQVPLHLSFINTMDSPYIPSYGRGGSQPADDIANLDRTARIFANFRSTARSFNLRPPAPQTSMAASSIQQHQPASSSAASTITVKPAPMSRNPSMASAPRNAPFPGGMGADPWADALQKKQQESMMQRPQLDRNGKVQFVQLIDF